ncbi:tyrosine phosphatase family protein [Agrobacterium bohemicum]|uniref:Protein tyrosine phosphatase n=1 Tax=Agrobacterium bohemicum TaxID=2052828 RepID=A0A135P4R3_9HYPH|nr:tyrosine phosphatase family protein [Agrobacterium bohemicum]KXG86421.1 protein tyrosine phosphatase [Agrobacterium bohemicum]
MSAIVVSPLSRIAEMAVRHKSREMVTLIAKEQAFHRPAVIAAERHLTLQMNDISFKGTDKLIAPDDVHVQQLIDFAHGWDQSAPLLVHCWMGISRSPAAAVIVSLTVHPEQDDAVLAARLRSVSPFATPNTRIIEIGDRLLGRGGALIAAIKTIGRGADTDGNVPFVLPLQA